MSTLRQVCAVTILSLSIAVSASAGDVHSPGAPTPPTNTTPSITTSVILTIVRVIYG